MFIHIAYVYLERLDYFASLCYFSCLQTSLVIVFMITNRAMNHAQNVQKRLRLDQTTLSMLQFDQNKNPMSVAQYPRCVTNS